MGRCASNALFICVLLRAWIHIQRHLIVIGVEAQETGKL